ncbi:MAG TPA: ABC transporter ATP-binding protein [Candidatus Acidoferrum sp.]|jgi:lipopolysaccharide transport system ATP-binding protein|nr:ABC transporter ATP-binding protein [Candidatus Acidoferrum sp.]
MSSAIRVENLSKKYILRHQPGKGRHRYVALRDVLVDKFSSLFRRHDPDDTDTREEFWALNNVSFEIQQGDAVGIIGRNGAGKSTLLKLLSRITEPSKGQIELEGRVASLLEVGTGFHPELTGRENIFLNGAILGMTRVEIKRKFDEIVAFAEVEKFLDTPVKHYSSGMYMRLAFGVAAHLEPEILIVDEVLAVGDAAFQKKCLGKMQQVGQSGRTVLFVSHNMDAIARLCSKCFYLVKGELQMTGIPRDVIKAYSEHSKQVSGEIDLARMPRRFEGTGAGRLLRLRSLQNGNVAAWCYEYGAPLEFALEFSVDKLIEEAEVGYSIFSLMGTELIGATTYQEHTLDRLEPGQYEMRITIPGAALNPGTYVLSVGIAGTGRSVDHILEAAQVEIIPSSESIDRGLHKVWAAMTPRTAFDLKRL